MVGLVGWALLWGSLYPQRFALALEANEQELRAAVIVGILRFTSWPERVPGDYRLCTLGTPPSEAVLLGLSGRALIGAHAIDVRVLKADHVQGTPCEVVVMGIGLEARTAKALLEDANHHGMLTVCDGCGRHAEHSMVNLVRNSDRIGFEVNTAITQAQGLLFSSALLELASRVRP
jgi:hypothetical protein